MTSLPDPSMTSTDTNDSQRPTLGSAAELLRKTADHLESLYHSGPRELRAHADFLATEQARIAGIEAVLAEWLASRLVTPSTLVSQYPRMLAADSALLRLLRGSSDTETTEGGTDNG